MFNTGFNRADRWAGSSRVNPQRGNTEERTFDTARLIAESPYTIIITRWNPITKLTFQLAPQIVRIELYHPTRGGIEAISPMMNELSIQNVVVIGYKDHPTIPNTDMMRGDQFLYQNLRYDINETIPTITGVLLMVGQVTPD